MARYLFRRLAFLPLILIGVTLILFLISQVMPADPVRLMIGDVSQPEVRANIERVLGLDQPLHVQYWRYLERLVQGDFGTSLRFRRPVLGLVAEALPASLQLVAFGAVVCTVISLFLGMTTAVYRDSWYDVSGRTVALFGLSIPTFFSGILAILVFGFYLDWFPTAGRGDPPDFYHLILPGTVLAFRYMGSPTRLLRAGMLDAFKDEYVAAAKARGIRDKVVRYKYAARNAMIPTVTELGTSFADIAGGVILIEAVFAWPGIGRLLHLGILYNDFPVVSGATIVLVIYAVLVNLAVDLLYGFIDPRVRLQRSA